MPETSDIVRTNQETEYPREPDTHSTTRLIYTHRIKDSNKDTSRNVDTSKQEPSNIDISTKLTQ